MAHYLVTGGAGFIGSHLSESLIADGHAVRVLDDLSTGRIENLPRRVELIEGDVTRQDAVRRAMLGVDGCFHLAAVASVERCHNEWLRSHDVNLGGTITVFEAAAQGRARRGTVLPVVYASSAAVYGCANQVPLSECTPTQPLSFYGVDKLACEMHAAIAARIHRLSAVGLRFFNVYGPRQNADSPYSGVISIFSNRILHGNPINIHGDGKQVRDFLFVEDAVLALRRALGIASPCKPRVFNVCTGRGISINELAQKIADICGNALQPRYVEARIGDSQTSIGSPRYAQAELGFSAETCLERGLADTINSIGRAETAERAPSR